LTYDNKYLLYVNKKQKNMRTLLVKMLLVLMLIFIFGSFQYGYIDTPPPFKDSWQSWFAGVALTMGILILLQEVITRLRNKEYIY
jgi:hypothetical protein